jgi:DNA-binding IclR family transcriptional regulator
VPKSIGVESVRRALLLLRCFEAAAETLTLAQLARRSGLAKSTILRVAATLLQDKFLQRDDNGRFSLGSEIRRLGLLSQTTDHLQRLLRPELQELASKTQETASFYVRQGRHRLCLFRENSPRSVRHYLVEGGRHELFAGASGKLFKAYRNARDPGDPEVGQLGWAASRGERDADLAAVAVPILSSHGQLLGVLNISAVLSRFPPSTEKRARNLLIKARARIEKHLQNLYSTDIVPSG